MGAQSMTRYLHLLQIVVHMAAAAFFLPPAAAWALGEEHVYKEVDGRKLRIYVTKPEQWKSSDQRPAIVFFHGGGWVGGKPGQFDEHARYFASRGLVCFQVEYRLLDGKSSDPPTICIEDAVDAMRWVRTHASEFGVDPHRIAAAGGSAGGHLAAYLGCCLPADDPADRSPETVSAKPNALLLFNPVYDNGPGGWGTKRVGNRYPEFSPLHNISADDPPSIVFLGTEDKLIPVATAEKFRDRCQAAGVYSELHTYEGQPHGFFNFGRSGNRYFHATVTAADRFLAKLGWLEGPPTLPAPAADAQGDASE
ncbi:MAG: alpha/beta hydrolase [Planctomycetota bacterium]|nr:MAG: alpha/beta hydrolase [Planctomycetota bacterium]